MHRTVAFFASLFLLVNGTPDAGDLDTLIDNINKNGGDGGYGGNNKNPRPIATNISPVAPSGEVVTCTTESGEDGECVQYYLCNDQNVINEDGAGLIDIRIMGACSYLEVCCKPGSKSEHPITQAPPVYPGGNGGGGNYNPGTGGIGGPGTGGHGGPGTGGIGPGTGGHGPGTGGHGTGGPGTGGHGTGGPGTGGIGPGTGGHGSGTGGHGNGGDGGYGPDNGAGGSGGGYNPAQPRTLGCGIRNEYGVGFRIKGDKDNEAQFGEFPWMCAILREEAGASNQGKKLNVYQCGGSLIHPKVVLTAAHCVTGAGGKGGDPKLKVRAGEWDTQTKKEILPHQDRNVVKIIKHDQYYAGGLFNDIALLILDKEFDDAENIGIVCLPPANSKPPLTKCLASGWGKDVFGKEGKYQVILKKVELPVVEHGKCEKALRKTRLGQRFQLHKSFTCAGGEAGKDTCKGDGGSPLVCPIQDHPDRYMQTGIVAWGIGCGENSTPGVYANVAYLREWIDEQMIYNNIDLAPYHHF